MSRTIYINRKDCYGNLETVDEFTEGRKYAIEMLREYRFGDSFAHYYMSQKPCKNWLESYKEVNDEI